MTEENKQENAVQEEEKKEEKEEVKSPSMVESAHAAAQELKKQNEVMQANIKKLEELKAINMLGGQSDAGEQPEKPKEETPKEYKERIMKGDI